MRINLPNSAFLGNFDPFLRSYDSSNPDVLEITANKSWISVHPVALAMVASLGLSGEIKIKCEPFEAKSKHYFKRMGLFDLLHIDSGIDIVDHDSSGRFIPLTIVNSSEELTRFITEMIPLLHLPPDKVDPIKYTISELVRNVFEHSRSEIGAVVCAQYYKDKNIVRIGIVDSGVGIRTTISQSHNVSSDLDALQLALTPGITGTTSREGGTENNAGAGLFFIKSIATVTRDFFLIYSGNAMFKLLKRDSERIRLSADPFKDKHSSGENYPYWKGTVVGIDLSLDNSIEFSELLDEIRAVYTKSIAERKRDKYKRPKFI